MKSADITNHYDFHGLRIVIMGGQAVSEVLHSRLRQFATDNHSVADLTFEFCYVSDAAHHAVERPPERAQRVYEPRGGEVVYLRDEDQLFITYDDSVRLLCDFSRGHTHASIVASEADNLWLISHPMFTIPFIESLKRRGRFNIHAAGLCAGGKGLILAGNSGSGKSTLSVALLRAGFGFLGDDMIFLASGAGGLKILAFPDEIDLTDETARLFPELNHLLGSITPVGWPKHRLRAEEVYKLDFIPECSPAAVVIVRIAGARKSLLERMDKGEALLELAPNVLLTEARSSQSHLDILAEVVEQCECYHLEAGRDFDDLPAMLRDLL